MSELLLNDQLALPRCHYCGVNRPLIYAVSAFETKAHDGSAHRAWKAYTCSACGGVYVASARVGVTPLKVIDLHPEKNQLDEEGVEILGYLEGAVASDFKEALTCHAAGAYNAFAAMCRRCVQSISMSKGAPDTAKVLSQLRAAKDLAGIDEQTYTELERVVIQGHDGAHPNLAGIDPDRAALLLEIMKEALRQLYVREARIKAVTQKRIEAIQAKKLEGAQGAE